MVRGIDFWANHFKRSLEIAKYKLKQKQWRNRFYYFTKKIFRSFENIFKPKKREVSVCE